MQLGISKSLASNCIGTVQCQIRAARKAQSNADQNQHNWRWFTHAAIRFLYGLASAGRFSPLGPLDTVHDFLPMIDKRVSWAAIPAPLDTTLTNQSATRRIAPLLIAEMTCH